jgi:hypothetical protein
MDKEELITLVADALKELGVSTEQKPEPKDEPEEPKEEPTDEPEEPKGDTKAPLKSLDEVLANISNDLESDELSEAEQQLIEFILLNYERLETKTNILLNQGD